MTNPPGGYPPPPGSAPPPPGGYAPGVGTPPAPAYSSSPPSPYAPSPYAPQLPAIGRTGQVGIRRSPIAQWLMMLIPIYGIVHICSVPEQLKRYDERVGGSGVATFFAYIPGAILLGIPVFISLYRNGERIGQAQRAAGLQPSCSGVLSIVLGLVLSLNVLYWQAEMMKIWDRYPGAQTGQQVPLFA